MNNNVDQIKDRLNIVDVVSGYIQLQKAGMNFRARCPFHQERTPSFFVSPTRNTYHCFGCNRGGDMFTFVQEMEGVDFKGALSLLAPQAGVTLEAFDSGQASEKDALFKLIDTATLFYQRNLTQNKEALAYLYKRGLTAETLKQFRIGFAQNDWSTLRDYLAGKGFTGAQMEKAGLVINRQTTPNTTEGAGQAADNSRRNGCYDRFRSRIMFPIADTTGRIVGFSGRIFGVEDDKMGKYINSPETTLFNKSRILYGFDKAKEAIRKKGRVVLVEGQMDVLLSHQEGVPETVAASGTAFSDVHAQTFSRLADKAILAFDDDEAGLAATRRSAITLLARGLDVRVAEMDTGTDPADMIQADKNAWESCVSEAKHVITFLLYKMKRMHPDDDRAFKRESSKHILPLVKAIHNSVDREHFISHVADTLRVPEDAIREELQKVDTTAYTQQSSSQEADNFAHTESVEKTRKDILEEHIASIILWQEGLATPHVDIVVTKKALEEAIGKQRMDELVSVEKEEADERVFEVELYFQDTKHLPEHVNDLITAVQQEYAREAYEQAVYELRQAEEKQDEEQIKKMLKKCQELSQHLH